MGALKVYAIKADIRQPQAKTFQFNAQNKRHE
jgi:hypothetical protein